MSRGRSTRARAVVTGAGSGIGRAFAVELARRGGTVVCADVNDTAAKQTVQLIGNAGVPAHCDVSDSQQVRDLAQASEGLLGGPPTLVINNAGIGAGGQPVGATPLADWKRTLDVNLWGVIHGCHEFVPLLRATGTGGIINVASAAGFAAGPAMAAYNVSKAGVLALSETLAAELSGTDIAVTVLCPTFVKTNIIDSDRIDAAAARLADTMMRLTGVSPHRVARTTLDAHDAGRLHVVPQLDARLVWRTKRALPGAYTRLAGLVGRLLPSIETPKGD
ncbi:SDR family NAD(P)-dependent oxidoreductase [Kibdelosporangium phytohabitans]|uniref:Short-chain dehydrogenase n=1 Tax=Kibdelosporangium phytohabitans TaxID=860235 RepID=A0A0N9HZT4_9PSEU|nr:SDR family NAD(P)-dependent oxidoreductase [Kibdelosporangium phytohabitans]ALG08914.1 short-chain dehydrogenase [Kibdelosporangium phytohabitans]MBE1469927.1 NAD(P)-dependent dehydrogenase (short-subunit alcohol dehydrogenase family) [Kibdelosporangium phytohabitans]